MIFNVKGFDWDRGNRTKCQKHGVSIAAIESLFRNSPRVAPAVKHLSEEERFIAVGRTDMGRALFVAFTIRVIDKRRFIRPVSARYMHAKEVAAYEKEGSASKD